MTARDLIVRLLDYPRDTPVYFKEMLGQGDCELLNKQLAHKDINLDYEYTPKGTEAGVILVLG